MIELDEYQNAALQSATKFAELVGKMFRDDGGEMSEERRVKLAYELGDVLMVCCCLCG